MAGAIDLAARIAAESAALRPEKQNTVLDSILFMKERAELEVTGDGDAAWERVINRPAGYPKLGRVHNTFAVQAGGVERVQWMKNDFCT